MSCSLQEAMLKAPSYHRGRDRAIVSTRDIPVRGTDALVQEILNRSALSRWYTSPGMHAIVSIFLALGAFVASQELLQADLAVPDALPACSDFQVCSLKVAVQFPANSTSLIPLVLFFPGFGTRPTYYAHVLGPLAAAGYGVVTYTYEPPLLLSLQDMPDTVELAVLPSVLAWARDELGPQVVDASRLGLMGHSRGARLAALFLSTFPYQERPAIFLMDPGRTSRHVEDHLNFRLPPPCSVVDDINGFTPSFLDPEYPEASTALRQMAPPPRMAVVSSGIPSRCSRTSSNSALFLRTAAAGSWSMTLYTATHMASYRQGDCFICRGTDQSHSLQSFASAGPILDQAADAICASSIPANAISRAEVGAVVGPLAISWFGGELSSSAQQGGATMQLSGMLRALAARNLASFRVIG